MFHDEVLAAEGHMVDFHRASVLMDRDLLSASLWAMILERSGRSQWDAKYGVRWIWDDYCRRHLERHGEPFGPDVNPAWDYRTRDGIDHERDRDRIAAARVGEVPMFYDEVLAAEGHMVDFDSVSLLMDRDLLAASLRALMRERNTTPEWDADDDAQWVWGDYCDRHLERYGESFGPDINPAWDYRIRHGIEHERHRDRIVAHRAEILMFHDEVLTWEGRAVDFERASALMDRDLLAASLRAMMRERNTSPRWDAVYGAQWVWEDFCDRHLERYGEEFGPEINPDWDSLVSQPESASPPRQPVRR